MARPKKKIVQPDEVKLQEMKLLEERLKLQEGLPHLYRLPMYKWQLDYYNTTNKQSFICAANQIGKSTIQIRKAIEWATNQEKWPTLWDHPPRQFWYLYPTKMIIDSEIDTKWIPELLPKGEFKKSNRYGWELRKDHGHYSCIEFKNGVFIYFKTYSMDAQDLQSGSIDAIFCDEELPFSLYPELNGRFIYTDGYLSMVFTATLGQTEWFETIEMKGERERFKGAFKRQVSLYDCLEYADGQKSRWTKERIQEVIRKCSSDAEVQRRVYGRFVVSGGLMLSSFSRERNVKPHHPLNFKSGHVYAGVDIGTGGEKGHPASICFVWVNEDFTQGRVFRGWRGDGIETAVPDILKKFKQMKGDIRVTGQYYDYHSKEFFMIATRIGEAFQPADKAREKGYQILNSLFKTGALQIYDLLELEPLVEEITMLKTDADKRVARDDFLDALRYAVSQIPWNWEMITGNVEEFEPEKPMEVIDRRKHGDDPNRTDLFINDDIEAEIRHWNKEYGS